MTLATTNLVAYPARYFAAWNQLTWRSHWR